VSEHEIKFEFDSGLELEFEFESDTAFESSFEIGI